jgi:hypothetical protein
MVLKLIAPDVFCDNDRVGWPKCRNAGPTGRFAAHNMLFAAALRLGQSCDESAIDSD